MSTSFDPPDLGKLQRYSLITGGVALVLFLIGMVINREGFHQAYIFAFTFWLGISVGSLALLMLQHLTSGGWGFVIRRVLEASTRVLPLMAILFLPIVLGAGYVYPWTNHEEALKLGDKAKYLNLTFFTIRAIIYLASWLALMFFLNRWSLAQDRTGDPYYTKRMRMLSGPGMVLLIFTVTFASVDWYMGVISELIANFSRKNIFGYKFVAFSSLAIAVFGFLVWGHHMFVSGQSVYAGMIFSFLSFAVAIPSAVKVFNWTATLYKGSISYDTPMLYGLGFIGLFLIGGMTGLFLATIAVDIHVTDTYFVVAHFHYVMVGGTLMGYLGGLHYWWPKISGRMYPEGWGRFAALVIFVGFNLTFLPQFVAGYLGMPRRYHAYPPEFQVFNVLSSAGATILGIGTLIPVIYLVWSMRYGRHAEANPWHLPGLEWRTQSPPPTENFTISPVVTWEAYEFAPPEEMEVVGTMGPGRLQESAAPISGD